MDLRRLFLESLREKVDILPNRTQSPLEPQSNQPPRPFLDGFVCRGHDDVPLKSRRFVSSQPHPSCQATFRFHHHYHCTCRNRLNSITLKSAKPWPHRRASASCSIVLIKIFVSKPEALTLKPLYIPQALTLILLFPRILSVLYDDISYDVNWNDMMCQTRIGTGTTGNNPSNSSSLDVRLPFDATIRLSTSSKQHAIPIVGIAILVVICPIDDDDDDLHVVQGCVDQGG
jgi:hypothetical protein